MVTGGGAHLQQTHTKKYLSSIYSSIILHHKSAAAVLVHVVDSNRSTQLLQQPRPAQTEKQQSLGCYS